MPSLLEFQRNVRAAILLGDAIDAGERLDIHRNNVMSSLREALAEMFPVVRRLVGDGFFDYAAHEFIRAHPPQAPCVADYGETFADFLSAFPPCRELVYLADVARFERLLQRAARRADAVPMGLDALSTVAPEDAHRLVFGFAPSYGYLCSPYPIARIWRANQPDATDEGTIDLAAGGVLLEVRRVADTVEFRELPAATFALRAALAGGAALGDAIVAVSGENPSFDAGAALAALFADDAVVDMDFIRSDLKEC